MNNIQKRTGTDFSLQSIGKMLLYVYIVLSFITSSGFLPSIFHSLSLYAMVAVALLYFGSGQRIELNRYIIWYLLFIILSFFSVLYTPITDWWSTIYTMIVIFAIAFSFTCFIKEKRDLYSLIYAFIIGSTLLILMLVFTGRLHEDERLGTTVMDNANSFASIYMAAVMLSIWYILYGDKKLYKLLIVGSVVLNFYALMLSGGRKYIFVPFIFAYILLLFKTDKRGRKHIAFYTFLIIILGIILYALVMNVEVLYDAIGVRIEGLIDAFFGEGGDGSSEIRKKMIALAWERGWETPFFGHGVNSFKHLNKIVYGRYYYSHNNWLEIWYNHGAVGFVLFYSLYAAMVVGAIKNRQKTPEMSAFIVAYIVSIFIFEFGEVTYASNPIQMLLCLCAILQNFKTIKKGEKDE